MKILLGFKMEKTRENLEYWAKYFTQILGHILIRDTENEIYWASPPLRLMVLFGQLHHGQTARSLPLYPDQRTPVPWYSAIFAFSSIARPQATTSTHPMEKFYLTKTTPSSAEWRRPLLLNKGSPLNMDEGLDLPAIYSPLNADEVWVIRMKYSFRILFFRSDFWNFLH